MSSTSQQHFALVSGHTVSIILRGSPREAQYVHLLTHVTLTCRQGQGLLRGLGEELWQHICLSLALGRPPQTTPSVCSSALLRPPVIAFIAPHSGTLISTTELVFIRRCDAGMQARLQAVYNWPSLALALLRPSGGFCWHGTLFNMWHYSMMESSRPLLLRFRHSS